MIRPQTCPICDAELTTNAATQSPLFPFCSKRCKMIDLSRWMEGKYAVVEPLT
ncbi:MAG: DNA gyrase inhibitor YacG, partial [Planctomycetaceae bacterium]|nr:DNA gyrase inhibitor YacG [Planctomycetaceae bacterium]